HARPLRRLTNGFGISRVVLLPLDERLDVARRDQPRAMAQLADLTGPVVSAGASFHRDDARRLQRQKTNKLWAGHASTQQRMPGSIRSMHLEYVLRDVQSDCGRLLHGRLLQ